MRGPTITMTLNDTNDLGLPNLSALPTLQTLIARHGTLAVGFAYLRAALIRKPRPPDSVAAGLSDHLLRDIGLNPRSPEARTGRRGWDF